jgi:tRNA(fMet)-specific endonuclease VapC
LSSSPGPRTSGRFGLIDRLIEVYETIPVDAAIGRRAYDLPKEYAGSHGLRTFDSLIAATAMHERRTLVTRNRKHFEMIIGLTINVPDYWRT